MLIRRLVYGPINMRMDICVCEVIFFLTVHTIPGVVFQRIFSASATAGIGVYLGRPIYVCLCLCGPVRDSEYKPIPY